MSRDAEFLQAILAAPADDAPRLVYADWLDERGDAARAEFIRLQCELARLPLSDPRVPSMRDREAVLLTEHHRAWLGPLFDWTVDWKCHRGFVEEVSLEARTFIDHAEEFFRLTPMRYIRFYNAGTCLTALTHVPHLRKAESLDFRCNQLGVLGVRHLVASRNLIGVCTLTLASNEIGNSGTVAVASSPCLSGLVCLNLADNAIGTEPYNLDGALALVRSPYLKRLHLLDLRMNQLSDEARDLLTERFSSIVLL